MGNFTNILISFFAVIIVSDSLNIASAQDRCKNVLELTGREHLKSFSYEFFEEWRSERQTSGSSSSGEAEYGNVGGGFSQSEHSSTEKEEYVQWKNETFSEFDSVALPALDAWRACMGADVMKVNARRVTADYLSVKIDMLDGDPQTILNISAEEDSGLVCKLNAEPITINEPLNYVLDLSDDAMLICERQSTLNTSSPPVHVTINTSLSDHAFRMPQKFPLSEYDSRDFSVLSKFGCNNFSYFPAKNYDVELRVADLQAYGDGTNGGASVRINGILVASSSGNRPEGNLRFATPANDGGIIVPAGFPIAIHSTGGMDNGDCEEVRGEIRFTPLP
jgi:hypothetical protein